MLPIQSQTTWFLLFFLFFFSYFKNRELFSASIYRRRKIFTFEGMKEFKLNLLKNRKAKQKKYESKTKTVTLKMTTLTGRARLFLWMIKRNWFLKLICLISLGRQFKSRTQRLKLMRKRIKPMFIAENKRINLYEKIDKNKTIYYL